ncbi:MAG: hypothetical protein WD737_03090 [Gemmatimonadota bacterium]
MGRIFRLGSTVALGLAVAACADEPAEDAALTESTLEEPAAPASEPAQPPAEDILLAAESLPGTGQHLTDGSGRALYLLEEEPPGQVTCTDACAEEWPPFLVSAGQATGVAAPAQPALIGTVQRSDGETQVTYQGKALYYYHDDTGPGQTTGHDLTDEWGEWYLVDPEGGSLE